MKRLPLVASFMLFILLCASVAYWGLQLFKPPLRPVAAPPRAAKADISPEAAATLFGGRAGKVGVASNYQLRGVVMSGSPDESIAILSANGKPALAVRVDAEVAPGVTVKEVHRDYVLLSDSGAVKRVELPENAKSEGHLATASPVRVQPQATPAPVVQQAPAATTPPAVTVPQANTGMPSSASSASMTPGTQPSAANPSVPAAPATATSTMAPPAVAVSRPNPQTTAPAVQAPAPAGNAAVPQQQANQQVNPPNGAAARAQGTFGTRR